MQHFACHSTAVSKLGALCTYTVCTYTQFVVCAGYFDLNLLLQKLQPLFLKMDEAALLLKIKEAEDAVAEAAGAVVKVTDAVAAAQTAFDGANGDNKQSYGQLLAAEKNALAAKEIALAAKENTLAACLNSLTQLRHQTFNKQRPSTGTCCLLIKSDGSVLSRDPLGL